MLNDGELWLTGNVQNEFVLVVGGFLAVTFFAALLLAYTRRQTNPHVVPLSTPRENDKLEEYIVVVYTSAWPGSQCPLSTSVYVNLMGTFHDSGSNLLKKQRSNQHIFTRGSVDMFVLHTKEILGNLENLELELKNIHEDSSNWKPLKFEIYKFDSRERWIADIIPSLSCKKDITQSLKLSKISTQIPRWKKFFLNFLGYHYWFFYLSNPQSFGIFSHCVRTMLAFFTETSLMFSNILCYVVYHEPDAIMSLSGSDFVGCFLALFTSSIVILGAEFTLYNIRPTFQKQFLGLPKELNTNDFGERLKDLEVYWDDSDDCSNDSDIQISGPVDEVRVKKAAYLAKKAQDHEQQLLSMTGYEIRTTIRRYRRYVSKRQNVKGKRRSTRAERLRKKKVRFASDVNKSNPSLDRSCEQQVDHFNKETDTAVDLTPMDVKYLWFEGRPSPKPLPGERMKIYTDACDIWETSSSKTSLLSIDSFQNFSYTPRDNTLSMCEQGQVNQSETNINFSSSTDTGSNFLDTTRKFATRTWNIISNADIKKWWFEGRKSDKPARGEHMHIYKTYSEDWDTRSSRSSLSEISDVPQHVTIDNFDLTPSDSLTFKSESDTSVHMTRSIEFQNGTCDDQYLFNKGPNKTMQSYRSSRTVGIHPHRPNRRTVIEKQNNARIDDSRIGNSLSSLALQYKKGRAPRVHVSPREEDAVRFICNIKKKSFFDVLSPSKKRPDSKSCKRPIDDVEIPSSEITNIIRKKSRRSDDSVPSPRALTGTKIEGSERPPFHKSAHISALPTIDEFDPDIQSKVIKLYVNPKNQALIQTSSINVPTFPVSPECASSLEDTQESQISLDIDEEDSMLELQLEREFEEVIRSLQGDPCVEDTMDMYFRAKAQMPDILQDVSFCTAVTNQSECSKDPSSTSIASSSTCSSITTVRENLYRNKDQMVSSSMDMLEKIADAVSMRIPGKSKSASTVTGSQSIDDTSSELERLASEYSCQASFSDPYLHRPLYPSEYISPEFSQPCQFSWLTCATNDGENFVPNLLYIILLDIDSLMTNEHAWAYIAKRAQAWCALVCRNLWNQIHVHLLDQDFVIKQDIRLKRIRQREKQEQVNAGVSGSFTSEIDLKTLLTITSESDVSVGIEPRCVLIDQEMYPECDCGRTECHQLKEIHSDLLVLASSILNQTVSDLFKLISRSEKISQESLQDLCDSIKNSLKSTAYDLAAVAVEPDLITCYEDLWLFSVDPGYQVLASIIVHKALRRGSAIYDYEWQLGQKAFILATGAINGAYNDIYFQLNEDSVVAELCRNVINEASEEVLEDFKDPIYVFSQHAIKRKLIHITKEIKKYKHELSFIEDAVKLLASVWRLEGLELSIHMPSQLVQALINRIFREQRKDKCILSNLAQLKEIEQQLYKFVKMSILYATNHILLCAKTGEQITQHTLRALMDKATDLSKEKSGDDNGANSKTTNTNQNQGNDSQEVDSTIRKRSQILAEEINFNLDVASSTVCYYLSDQSSSIFREYAFELEVSAMVDDIVLKARNSLITDELKKITQEDKKEKPRLNPDEKFEPSDEYLKMKSRLISYDVLLDAQMTLIEESIGDPFTLDSKETYELRKESEQHVFCNFDLKSNEVLYSFSSLVGFLSWLSSDDGEQSPRHEAKLLWQLGPLKMYSKFIQYDNEKRNKTEMMKELKKYDKRHRDYVTINLQNVADAHCITSTVPSYDIRDLYLLEWYLTGQLQKRLSPSLKVPLMVMMFLFTLFCMVFISVKGAELTITQCQQWMSLYLITSFTYAFIVTPIKALCITRFKRETEPFSE